MILKTDRLIEQTIAESTRIKPIIILHLKRKIMYVENTDVSLKQIKYRGFILGD